MIGERQLGLIPGLCTLQKSERYLLDGKGATQCLSPNLHKVATKKSLVSTDLLLNGNGKNGNCSLKEILRKIIFH